MKTDLDLSESEGSFDLTEKRCKNCKYFERYPSKKEEYIKFPQLINKFGECQHDKMLNYDFWNESELIKWRHGEYVDGILYSLDIDCGIGKYFGEDFGCIHFTGAPHYNY
jgi:hypothetical protein